MFARYVTIAWFSALLAVAFAMRPVESPAASVPIPSEADSLINKAQAAYNRGDAPVALELANKAVAAAPSNAQAYWVRGRIYGAQAEHTKAIADYDKAAQLEPRGAELYHLRGCERFKTGDITGSLDDFDKFLQFVPKQAPQHWQRGISCYYAGRFEEGRKQFELHQTVNPADVENAVWHFLCVAKVEGPEKARASLIPIKGDRRVPMMEIYELFAGKAKPEQVFDAAKAADKSKNSDPLFYANLYVGLYYEATRDEKTAAEYINKAAAFDAPHYMGDVARVDAALLNKRKLK